LLAGCTPPRYLKVGCSGVEQVAERRAPFRSTYESPPLSCKIEAETSVPPVRANIRAKVVFHVYPYVLRYGIRSLTMHMHGAHLYI
jgi:hypothetical protein